MGLRERASGLPDRVAEAVAWRVTDRLVARGVRAVSPSPWYSAGRSERERFDHGAQRLALAALLAPDSSCLDIGANEGEVLRHMVRCAPAGRHIAWEPLPALAQQLRTHFSIVEIREAALGAEAGEAEFVHVVGRTGYSGFKDRHFPEDWERELLRVQIERLDDVLEPGFAPAVMKIDVEGAEIGVLQGGAEMIARHRPAILFEHTAGATEYLGGSPQLLWDLVCLDLRLRIYDLDGEGPYSRDQFEDAVGLRTRGNWLARV